VLSGSVKELFDDSVVDKLLLTDTVPIAKEKISKKMKIISVGHYWQGYKKNSPGEVAG